MSRDGHKPLFRVLCQFIRPASRVSGIPFPHPPSQIPYSLASMHRSSLWAFDYSQQERVLLCLHQQQPTQPLSGWLLEEAQEGSTCSSWDWLNARRRGEEQSTLTSE